MCNPSFRILRKIKIITPQKLPPFYFGLVILIAGAGRRAGPPCLHPLRSGNMTSRARKVSESKQGAAVVCCGYGRIKQLFYPDKHDRLGTRNSHFGFIHIHEQIMCACQSEYAYKRTHAHTLAERYTKNQIGVFA